jgi:DHA1 family tetracycline resistance protein-like MFS transporter
LADPDIETGGAPQAAQLPSQPTEEAAQSGRASRKAAMPFIMIVVLIDMISVGLMVPVLPHIVGQFTASNDEQTLGFLAVTLTFGIAQFFGSPILGALSDRFGRRPVLLLGFMGLALSFFVTAVATALWMLVVVRMFSGAMQSNISIANAYVADISLPEERARRFGLMGAMFGVGFILGPVIGGILGDIDVRLPFVVAGSLALINWCYGFFVLPESLPKERRRAFEWRRANPIAALKGLAALKGVGALVWVIALASLAQFMLHMSWVLYTKFKFGWGPGQVGWSLFAVGVVSAFSQGVLLKPLLARFTPQQLAVVGLSVGALSYLGFGLATQGWMLYAVILLGLLGGTAQAAMQSIVSNAAEPTRQGQTMGAVTSLSSLMAVFAPVVALELLRWVSVRPPGDWLIGLPFFVCAALQAAAAITAWRFFRTHQSLRTQPVSA